LKQSGIEPFWCGHHVLIVRKAGAGSKKVADLDPPARPAKTVGGLLRQFGMDQWGRIVIVRAVTAVLAFFATPRPRKVSR